MKKYSDDYDFINYEYLRKEIYLLRRTRQIYLLLTIFTSTVFIGLLFYMANVRQFVDMKIIVFLGIVGYALIVLWINQILFLVKPYSRRQEFELFFILEEPDHFKKEIQRMQEVNYLIYKRNQRFFVLLCINWLLLIALSLFFFIAPLFQI